MTYVVNHPGLGPDEYSGLKIPNFTTKVNGIDGIRTIALSNLMEKKRSSSNSVFSFSLVQLSLLFS